MPSTPIPSCSNDREFPEEVKLEVVEVFGRGCKADLPWGSICGTSLRVLRTDRGERCIGFLHVVRMPDRIPDLEVGSVVIATQRQIVLNPEADVIDTGVLKRPSGEIVLATAGGTRPAVFERYQKDLFPGVSLSVDEPYCTTKHDIRFAAFRLTSADGVCVVRRGETPGAARAGTLGRAVRAAAKDRDWRERFWRRRYVAIVVADESAQVARLKYILRNGCMRGSAGA